jgi:hypothetical protein
MESNIGSKKRSCEGGQVCGERTHSLMYKVSKILQIIYRQLVIDSRISSHQVSRQFVDSAGELLEGRVEHGHESLSDLLLDTISEQLDKCSI